MEAGSQSAGIGGIMIKTLCIEGTKGAGKTTTISNIKAHLERKGYVVTVKAPFYDVRVELKRLTGYDNTFPASLDTQAAALCNNLLISQIKQDIAMQAPDEILIFDRGWLTGFTTVLGSVLSAKDKNKALKEWEKLLLPTVFIHTKPQNTLTVRQGELSFNVGLEDIKAVEHDYILRNKLIRKYKHCVIARIETFPLAEDKEAKQILLQNLLAQKILEH